MHENLDLILTLTGSLAAALALGYVTHRLGLSPIVGYLLAGVAVGPSTPGSVADQHLAVLPALFGRAGAGPGPGGLALAVGLAGLKIGALVGLTFLLGGRLIPWLLARVAAAHSRELFTLTVLVVALGLAVGSAKLFGVSMALGAFLAGMVVGRSDFSLRAAAEALPMRDAFAVLFFVSVGMLFDPHELLAAPALAAATLGVVLLGKPLAALVIVLMLRYPLRVALGVAVALAQ